MWSRVLEDNGGLSPLPRPSPPSWTLGPQTAHLSSSDLGFLQLAALRKQHVVSRADRLDSLGGPQDSVVFLLITMRFAAGKLGKACDSILALVWKKVFWGKEAGMACGYY